MNTLPYEKNGLVRIMLLWYDGQHKWKIYITIISMKFLYVNNSLRFGKQDNVDHILMHAGTRRICNEDVRPSVLVDEILRQYRRRR